MHLWIGGILTGVVLVGFIHAIFQNFEPINSRWMPDDWETLLVGIVALLHYQAYRKELAVKENRAALGATGRLTNDLSDITKYATKAMKFAQLLHEYILEINNIRELEQGPGAFSLDIETWDLRLREARVAADDIRKKLLRKKVPRLPQELIDRVADAGNHLGSDRVIDLLKAYQVQYARLSDYLERIRNPETGNTTHIVTTLNALSALSDAARIHVLAEKLFDEARRGWKFYNDDVTAEEIKNCLLIRIGWEGTNPTTQKDEAGRRDSLG
ncbi:hypothetical protein KFF05_04290 [bacterium SCSIO 12827]|nr:hypothetical protein KFF05_04290 [bacterium SCSIO 12827]